MPQSDLVRFIVEELSELKAENVSVLDVRKQTDFTDYMIIASGRSSRHVSSMADNLVQRAKQAGFTLRGSGGQRAGRVGAHRSRPTPSCT